MALRTDYKNDELNTAINTERQFEEVTNPNGTKSYRDVTDYSQVGDSFDADLVNSQNAEINAKAPLDSPAFTGTPTAPTQPQSTVDDTIATTAYVKSAFSNIIDPNLRTSGKAADAQATGDRIASVQESVPMVDSTLSIRGAAADAQAVGDAVANIPTVDTTLTIGGKAADARVTGAVRDIAEDVKGNLSDLYTVQSSDMESGYWGYCYKYSDSTRLRFYKLIPVKKGTVVEYTSPNLKVYFGVLETKSSASYLQTTGWLDAGSGSVNINYDGFMTLMVDSDDTITVSDFDSTIVIKSVINVEQIVSELTHAEISDDISFIADNEGYYWNSSGVRATNGFMKCSDFIEIPSNAVSITVCQVTRNASSVLYMYPVAILFKEDKTIHSVVSADNTSGSSYKTFEVDPTVVKYAKFNQPYGAYYTVDPLIRINKFDIDSVISEMVEEGFYKYVSSLTASDDLDSITASGTYIVPSSVVPSNCPFTGGGHVLVFSDTSGNVCQIGVGADGLLYHRRKATSESWTTWKNTDSGDLVEGIVEGLKYGNHPVDIRTEATTTGYIDTTGSVVANGSLAHTNGFITVDSEWKSIAVPASIYLANGNKFICQIPMAIFYRDNQTSIEASTPVITGDWQIFTVPQRARYVKLNVGAKPCLPKICWITKDDPYNVANLRFVGEYTGTFTASKQSINTRIYLEVGKKYIIKVVPVSGEYEYVTGGFNIFSGSSTSYWRPLGQNINETRYKPIVSDYLVAYNPLPSSGSAYLGKFKLRAYEIFDQYDGVEVYTVGKSSATSDFTSVTAAFLALKENRNPKILYIDEGEYDIYQEYKAAGVPSYEGDDPTYDYFDYCVWVPENTHVIGRGIVRLNWMPTAEDGLTSNESQTVSPINCAGSMTLENVEIHCKNGRYCIHDDTLGKTEYVHAIKKYINVRCYKYANDAGYGWTHTLGFGFDKGSRYEFHNCMFMNTASGRTLYGHSRGTSNDVVLTELESPSIVVDSCVMQTNGSQCVVFGNALTSAPLHIRVDMNNCYISGSVHVKDESGNTGDRRNAFDLKVLGGNITASKVLVLDQSNPYPPQIYSFS